MPRRARLALATAVALVVALVCNGLANALPLNGMGTGELSDLYPNLFVPMGATFSIWGVIYLGLTGLVVHALGQVRSPEPRTAVERMGPWMAVNLLANATWIFAWHWRAVALSVGVMGVILGTLLVLYRRVCLAGVAVGGRERWLVHVPIRVYLGWISVATVANVTALAVDLGVPAFGTAPAVATVVMVSVAVGLAVTMLVRHRDLAYALVIAWALLGIAVKRSGATQNGSETVALAAGAGLAVVLVGALWTGLGRRSSDPPG